MSNIDEGKPKYWKSLEEWRQDPEFLKMAETEFMSSPLQSQDGQEGWARREFLKLMGASLALTTFGCVRRPAQKIIPYAKKPLEVIHGFSNFYASSYVDGAEGLGILVATRDGRPIKIDGNPEHPWNSNGISVRGLSHIMKLYDPDRLTGPKRNLLNDKKTNRETISVTWDKLDEIVVAQLKKGAAAVLTSSVFSPSMKNLLGEFSSAYGAHVYHYDDISYEHVREGQKACYGRDAVPAYNVDKAKVIVAVNNDFLGTWLTPTRFQKQFGQSRKPGQDMNKLIVLEGLLSLTGTNADERYRVKPSQTLAVLLGLLKHIAPKSRYGSDSKVNSLIASAADDSQLGLPAGTLQKVAEALLAHKGRSLVFAGGMQADSTDAASIQIVANLLNSALDNEGQTVSSQNLMAGQGSQKAVGDLIEAINKGSIKTVIIHNCNPLYTLPEESGLRAALAKAEMMIYTGDRNDETGKMADYLACDHHPLENWGDVESVSGIYSIQQPTIRPLYETRAFQDGLLKWTQSSGKASGLAKAAKDWHDYIQAHWRDVIASAHKANFSDFWDKTLQLGFFESTAKAQPVKGFNTAALSSVKKSQGPQGGFELSLYSNIGLLDQNLANVTWLQEFPDPVTKTCWDNYACVAPADAKQLKIQEGQFVTLKTDKGSIKIPAHIQPGQAAGVIGLAVGYGRSGAGQVADGVGQNAYELASWKNGQTVTAGLPVQVTVESNREWMACVQEHHTMEGRQIVVEETLAQYLKKPGSTIHSEPPTTIWSEHTYNGHKWGMTVDLNTCTGCGSCMIACQSENNIPNVGRKNVVNGREMYWIRVDRYYAGDPENPDVVHQPLMCQHCDNAPCETVCPVIATMHSEEGTNDMIYNRCVGTRYCSNNCPYKVRRFNWFSYTDIPAPKHLALNPEVSVRSRGVMEKCTFCIHRIRETKTRFFAEGRTLKDGDIKTACQQACPTKAIVFGDTHDANSEVAQKLKTENRYSLLEELNTRPAVHYLTKVRNADLLKGPNESFNKKEESSTEEEHHS
jgi:molybdopterin-containing oxidoreductase family iron-sulfur binding subunit